MGDSTISISILDALGMRDVCDCFTRFTRFTGHRHDPCLLDTFMAAVQYMDGAPKRPWRKYTAERKREMAARTQAGN